MVSSWDSLFIAYSAWLLRIAWVLCGYSCKWLRLQFRRNIEWLTKANSQWWSGIYMNLKNMRPFFIFHWSAMLLKLNLKKRFLWFNFYSMKRSILFVCMYICGVGVTLSYKCRVVTTLHLCAKWQWKLQSGANFLNFSFLSSVSSGGFKA